MEMDLNLRHAIKSNINGNDAEQLQATIVDAIESGEEKMLPGLGVLFELYWNQASEDGKQIIVKGVEEAVN